MNENETHLWTTGIVHSYEGRSGKALVSFSATPEDSRILVDGMTMAQQGLSLDEGYVFSAEINEDATDIRGFRAIEQPLPSDTLDSVTQ